MKRDQAAIRQRHNVKTVSLPQCSAHGGRYIDYVTTPAPHGGSIPFCLKCQADAGGLTEIGKQKLADIEALYR